MSQLTQPSRYFKMNFIFPPKVTEPSSAQSVHAGHTCKLLRCNVSLASGSQAQLRDLHAGTLKESTGKHIADLQNNTCSHTRSTYDLGITLLSEACPWLPTVKHQGRDCGAAEQQKSECERQWSPSWGERDSPGSGKHEDNFRQTKCKENWILEPLTLLPGPS